MNDETEKTNTSSTKILVLFPFDGYNFGPANVLILGTKKKDTDTSKHGKRVTLMLTVRKQDTPLITIGNVKY